MKLCLAAGKLNFFAEMDTWPAWLLNWWLAYDQIDPIGESRADHRAAVMTAHIVARLQDEAVHPDDFRCVSEQRPEDDDELEDEDDDDLLDAIRERELREQSLFSRI